MNDLYLNAAISEYFDWSYVNSTGCMEQFNARYKLNISKEKFDRLMNKEWLIVFPERL